MTENQRKTIKDWFQDKQIVNIDQWHFFKKLLKIEEIEHEINRDDLICKAANKKKDKKGQVIFGCLKRQDLSEEKFIVVFLH